MTNYNKVLDEVRSVSQTVALLAVSKTRPYEDILSAYQDGARIFGENRVQEIVAKFSGERLPDMKVYLIGQLQSNKVKKAVLLADRIESVDSLSLLRKIDAECEKIGKTMEILLEVNSSGEEQKSGFRTDEEVLEAVELAKNLSHIKLVGLMTVGPLGYDEDRNRKAFSYAKALFDRISSDYPLSVLSMGMSGDWKTAIECGSTEVRIGTAIFGERS